MHPSYRSEAHRSAVDLEEREALRLRPPRPHVMYQNWSELLFAHYTADVDDVQALLPPGLSVDTHVDSRGRTRAWIGVVPFRMTNVRPRFVPPVPGLSAFLETNLRTYVHVEGKGPAVYFFSLDAANALACWVARKWFKLPYHHALMSSKREGDTLDYKMGRVGSGAALGTRFRITEPLDESLPGSLNYFLAERYLLVTDLGHGRLAWGRVHHRPYQLRNVEVDHFEETLSQAAGLPGFEPEHFCYCEGVETKVWPLRETPD